jgi:hypothetical protein
VALANVGTNTTRRKLRARSCVETSSKKKVDWHGPLYRHGAFDGTRERFLESSTLSRRAGNFPFLKQLQNPRLQIRPHPNLVPHVALGRAHAGLGRRNRSVKTAIQQLR